MFQVSDTLDILGILDHDISRCAAARTGCFLRPGLEALKFSHGPAGPFQRLILTDHIAVSINGGPFLCPYDKSPAM